ncbi:MAG TPA: archaeosortase/exosortase family protein, partial [Polyangiaceae bacterium]|nr:archaeosortase/exosortase family protein [Polyangiaceae bacterium]
MQFDGTNISSNLGVWAKLSDVGATVSIGVAVFTAGLIRKRDVLFAALADLRGQLGSVELRWCLVHALALAAFAATCTKVFAPLGLSSASAPLWILAWTSSALVTGLSLLRAAFGAGWWSLAWALSRVSWGGLALGMAAYYVGRWSQQFWPWLARQTLALSGLLLSLVTRDVYLIPERARVGLSGIEVEVAEACSGVEGIGLILVLVGGYLYTARAHLRWPRAVLLLPASVVTVWLLNAARVAALIAVAAWVSPAVAFGGFHSKAGWIAVCAVGLGAVWLAERSAFFAREPAPEVSAENPTAVYLTPLLALIGLGMVTGLFAAGVDWLYAVRWMGAGAVLWAYRRHYANLWGGMDLAALGVGALVFVVWLVLVKPSDPGMLGSAVTSAPAALRVGWLVTRVIGTALVVPIVEELAF